MICIARSLRNDLRLSLQDILREQLVETSAFPEAMFSLQEAVFVY